VSVVRRHSAAARFLGLLRTLAGAAALAGCGAPFVDGASERYTAEMARSPSPGAYRLLDVPFFPDNTDQCGPATLASVLTFWGAKADPQQVREDVYTARLRGTLPIDLIVAAQARGMGAEAYQGTLENVEAELKAGRPLIAFLDVGLFVFKQGHYVVITGYDQARQGLYAHSGMQRNRFIPYAEFSKQWNKTGRWTLRVVPTSAPALQALDSRGPASGPAAGGVRLTSEGRT
jgi:hypothetical protein